jgi:hypothetical protein
MIGFIYSIHKDYVELSPEGTEILHAVVNRFVKRPFDLQCSKI